jgi:Putative auto-transporter adhesin, head GIN domain
MIRGILLVAVGGLALSTACFGMAAVRGPTSWHVPGMGGLGILMDDDEDTSSPAATRTLDWKGGDALTFEVPATIVYTQGAAPGITISGPKRVVDRVMLDGNVIGMNRESTHHWGNHLRIVVTAPALKTLTVRSAGSLTLNNVAVDHLHLTVEGAASVEGHGRADSITLNVAGAAHADLSDMIVTDADLDIAGAGHVSVGPTGHASIHLSGVGAVELTRRPASLTKDIDGIGTVTEPDEPEGTQL